MDGLILADSAHYEHRRLLEDPEHHHRNTQNSEKQRVRADAANYEHRRLLEDPERHHKRTQPSEKQRARAKGRAEGFAEGMQQAMQELKLWDNGFPQWRAPMGTLSNRRHHRSETLRIEVSAQRSRHEIPHHGSNNFASPGVLERREIAMRVDSRGADGDARTAASRPAHHSGCVVSQFSLHPMINRLTLPAATEPFPIAKPVLNARRPVVGKPPFPHLFLLVHLTYD